MDVDLSPKPVLSVSSRHQYFSKFCGSEASLHHILVSLQIGKIPLEEDLLALTDLVEVVLLHHSARWANPPPPQGHCLYSGSASDGFRGRFCCKLCPHLIISLVPRSISSTAEGLAKNDTDSQARLDELFRVSELGCVPSDIASAFH